MNYCDIIRIAGILRRESIEPGEAALKSEFLLYKNQHICLFEQRITGEMPAVAAP